MLKKIHILNVTPVTRDKKIIFFYFSYYWYYKYVCDPWTSKYKIIFLVFKIIMNGGLGDLPQPCFPPIKDINIRNDYS